jgi:RNA polymerase sigma factor (sigma-70 family)
MNGAERNDADLVAESLAGSREAFRAIVERYQTLICSLAYNGTGNLGQSEDVAQETFLTAWTDLRTLREPAKLRSWLCGIVRHRIGRSVRSEAREPARNAVPLDDAREVPACGELPSEQAISREEEAILWRSLERIPDLYREPLILFYREHGSIEHVARALELSEDAVKQRLSRGRKLLQEEVQAFVESTLRRTAPGNLFSGAVLAALPMASAPAAAAGMGLGAKGTAAAKTGFVAAWLAPLTPFLGIAAGAGAQCLLIHQSISDPGTRAKKMAQVVLYWVVVIGLAWLGENTVGWLARHFEWSDRTCFVAVAVYWWSYMCLLMAWMGALVRLGLNLRMTNYTTGDPQADVTPTKAGTLALTVAGAHLALFTALVWIAWRHGDILGAGTVAGTAVVLAVWAFFRLRGKTGLAAAQASATHFWACLIVIFLAFNLRIDTWVAAAHGVTVAEAQRLRPLWIVPALTLALVAWTAVCAARARRKHHLAPL